LLYASVWEWCERGKRKQERGKRKEERGKRKEERGQRIGCIKALASI